MRRKFLKLSALCAFLVLPLGRAQAQGSPCATAKIAFVNGTAILASIPMYVRADSQWEAEVNTYKADIAKQRANLDSQFQVYQDRSTLLNSTQKAAEMKKLQDQNTQLQQHTADLEQQAGQRHQQLLEPIQTRVQDMIDGLRAELNCSIIFDVSNQQAGIASADKTLDLTNRVIERLKAAGDLGTPVTSPAGKAPAGLKPPGSSVPPKTGGGGRGGGGEEFMLASLP